MPTPAGISSRDRLQAIARRAMLARGLAPEFTPAALAEVSTIGAAAQGAARDLRSLPWCSIDNDDSRDLDQLSVAEARPGGATRMLVAIADVTSVVVQGSALDAHARQNTTSVYTAAQIFPMLPERLSTDLTSLNLAADRRAVVVEMVFSADGALATSDIYAALVCNRAKLATIASLPGSKAPRRCRRRSMPCPVWPTTFGCSTGSPSNSPRCGTSTERSPSRPCRPAPSLRAPSSPAWSRTRPTPPSA